MKIETHTLKSWKTGMNEGNGEPVLVVELFNGFLFGIQMPAITALKIAAALTDLGKSAGRPDSIKLS